MASTFPLSSPPSDIQDLIAQLSDRLEGWLKSDGVKASSKPSQGSGWTTSSPNDGLSRQLIGRLEHLKWLLYDPVDYLKELTQGRSLDIGTVRALVRLNIPASVPINQDIAVEELASKVSITPKALARLLSYAETLGLFRFTRHDKSHIAHTAFSAGLREGIYAELAIWDVTVPPAASLELWAALQKFGSCEGPENAPFKMGLKTEDNFYQWHANNPKYGNLFHKGMASEQEDPRTSPQHIVRAYNWEVFSQKVIVDLGGSAGHVARSILEAYPDIRIIVQDQADIIATAEQTSSMQLEFMAHDFFQEQPCSADAYLLRYIFHNWTDKDCRRILKALRPALRDGTKLFVMELLSDHEMVSPETWFEDRIVRRRDMQMMSFIGASERSMSDYNELVRSEIAEFRFDGCHKPAGSFVAMLEWTFVGAQANGQSLLHLPSD